MLASERVVAGTPLALYWEVSGVTQGTQARFAVRLERTRGGGGGILSFFTGIFGGNRGGASLVSWTEPITFTDGIAGHSVNVNLGSLSEGTYDIQLELTLGNRLAAVSRRSIDIIRREPERKALVEVLLQPVPREVSGAPRASAPAIRDRTGRLVPPG
jgi:hypothetical protein